MPLKLALSVRETAAGRRLGALEGGGGVLHSLPMHPGGGGGAVGPGPHMARDQEVPQMGHQNFKGTAGHTRQRGVHRSKPMAPGNSTNEWLAPVDSSDALHPPQPVPPPFDPPPSPKTECVHSSLKIAAMWTLQPSMCWCHDLPTLERQRPMGQHGVLDFHEWQDVR